MMPARRELSGALTPRRVAFNEVLVVLTDVPGESLGRLQLR